MKYITRVSWIGALLILGCGVILSSLQPDLAGAQKEDAGLQIMFTPGANLYRLKPGVDATSYLELHNNGDKLLSDIRLSADIPEGWSLRFLPDRVAKLDTDSIVTVDVVIRPAESAARGDYQLAIIAETDGIRRVTSVYVNVQPEISAWLWPALGLAALLIAGFIFIFIRMGRG